MKRTRIEALTDWVSRQLDVHAESLVVHHVIAGETGGRILQWRVQPTDRADVIAMHIDEKATETALAWDGDQKFYVSSLGPDSSAPLEVMTLRIAGGSSDGMSLPETRVDTALTIRSMQQAEAAFKISVGSQGAVFRRYERMLEKADRRIEQLEGKYLEAVSAAEKLLSAAHDRKLASIRAEQELEQGRAWFETLQLLGPVAINSLSRKLGLPAVLPERTTPKDEILVRLLESIEPGQLEALRSVFRTEQFVALAQLFSTVQSERAAASPRQAPSPQDFHSTMSMRAP